MWRKFIVLVLVRLRSGAMFWVFLVVDFSFLVEKKTCTSSKKKSNCFLKCFASQKEFIHTQNVFELNCVHFLSLCRGFFLFSYIIFIMKRHIKQQIHWKIKREERQREKWQFVYMRNTRKLTFFCRHNTHTHTGCNLPQPPKYWVAFMIKLHSCK